MKHNNVSSAKLSLLLDYCLAQTVALQFWTLDQQYHGAAWEKYPRLVKFAGTKTFSDLLKDAGMPTPFEGEAVKSLCEAASNWLEK